MDDTIKREVAQAMQKLAGVIIAETPHGARSFLVGAVRFLNLAIQHIDGMTTEELEGKVDAVATNAAGETVVIDHKVLPIMHRKEVGALIKPDLTNDWIHGAVGWVADDLDNGDISLITANALATDILKNNLNRDAADCLSSWIRYLEWRENGKSADKGNKP